MAAISPELLSEEAYLERERASLEKSEYLRGAIHAMPGGSAKHNLITANLVRHLGNAVAGGPCLVLSSDQRVHVPETGLYTYPDVTVCCGRPEFHPKDRHTLLNPTVLVEVLSESTAAYDRGAKFGHYRGVASLREYVLVAQGERAERLVEHFHKLPATGQWLFTEHRGDAGVLELPTLSVKLALRDIYAGVERLEDERR